MKKKLKQLELPFMTLQEKITKIKNEKIKKNGNNAKTLRKLTNK